ncbi:hypothetical protein Ancab_032340 [Ancistrocladus abbreviatus]
MVFDQPESRRIPTGAPALLLILLMIPMGGMSWDWTRPPPAVKALCHNYGAGKMYWTCINIMNTGSTAQADMRYLALYAEDVADSNATSIIDYLNKTLLPSHLSPYEHEVLLTCLDAFTTLQNRTLQSKVDKLALNDQFEEASAWAIYAIANVNSCHAVCTARPHFVCPLTQQIQQTKIALELMALGLKLIAEGNTFG